MIGGERCNSDEHEYGDCGGSTRDSQHINNLRREPELTGTQYPMGAICYRNQCSTTSERSYRDTVEQKKNIDPWEKMKVVMQTEIHVAKACIRSTYDERDIMQTALDTEVQ